MIAGGHFLGLALEHLSSAHCPTRSHDIPMRPKRCGGYHEDFALMLCATGRNGPCRGPRRAEQPKAWFCNVPCHTRRLVHGTPWGDISGSGVPYASRSASSRSMEKSPRPGLWRAKRSVDWCTQRSMAVRCIPCTSPTCPTAIVRYPSVDEGPWRDLLGATACHEV